MRSIKWITENHHGIVLIKISYSKTLTLTNVGIVYTQGSMWVILFPCMSSNRLLFCVKSPLFQCSINQLYWNLILPLLTFYWTHVLNMIPNQWMGDNKRKCSQLRIPYTTHKNTMYMYIRRCGCGICNNNHHHIHLSKIQFYNTFKYVNQLGKVDGTICFTSIYRMCIWHDG